MAARPPLHPEAELRHIDREQKEYHYVYDQITKLTYFVISIELIFCGYVLLNAEKLALVKYSSILFLLAGSAAITGIIWRTLYNIDLICGVKRIKQSSFSEFCQKYSYYLYVSLTLLFLLGTVLFGYLYLKEIPINNKTNDITHEIDQYEKTKQGYGADYPAWCNEGEVASGRPAWCK